MKILFFSKVDFRKDSNFGIVKKIKGQCEAFSNLGDEVDLLYKSGTTSVLKSGNEVKNLNEKNNKWSFIYSHFIKSAFLVNANKYDLIYVRHFLMNPLFLFFLLINYRSKIVLEIPTYPYKGEIKMGGLKDKLSILIDAVVNLFSKFFIYRIITFSNEDSIFGIQTIKIHNAINVKQIHLKNPVNATGFRLVAMGHIQKWHGYDRLVHGLAKYYSGSHEENIMLDIVGDGPELANLKEIVSDLNLTNHVIFHGFKSGEELNSILNAAHIGVSTLGRHRVATANGNTSDLKSREFLANGLPVLLGYHDRGLDMTKPFFYQVSADETPIHIDEVVNFYQSLKAQKNLSQEIFDYAKAFLTWDTQMAQVKSAL